MSASCSSLAQSYPQHTCRQTLLPRQAPLQIRQRRSVGVSAGKAPQRNRKGFGGEPTTAEQEQQSPTQSAESRSRPAQPSGRSSGIQEVPEVVNNRMLGRIILCAGVPTFTGVLLFPFFYWLRLAYDIKVPLPLVYAVQFLTFGGGLAGISYGILSASWDPKVEGSWLGLTEFKQNVPNVIASLRRKE